MTEVLVAEERPDGIAADRPSGLARGVTLVSNTGKARLAFQWDGNLVGAPTMIRLGARPPVQ